ncbi:hypothetical protein V7S43_001943 [Phytophthora oleae]|uniref:Small EDRK-rich factor-like N-terminal domain-containing protein n=1 Tax=Phytophthora oleae TaxID=2107226 RepID=A0ABD3G0G1_9STRA
MGNGDFKANAQGKRKQHSKAAIQNRANQLNPNNPAYYSSRGLSESDMRRKKAAISNRSNQLNPNNKAYHKSRAHG